jgi:hypothetical protein
VERRASTLAPRWGVGDVATTAVFVEILIIGLEAIVWIALAVAVLFGVPRVEAGAMSGWEALVTLALLAAAYVVGIFVDRVADGLWTTFRRFIALGPHKASRGDGRRLHEGAKPRVSVKRMTVMMSEDAANEFLEYQRSRFRIARATVLNLVIGVPVGAAYAIREPNHSPTAAIAVIAVGAALTFICIYATTRIQRAYERRLDDAYLIYEQRERSRRDT